jgi:TonB family protein
MRIRKSWVLALLLSAVCLHWASAAIPQAWTSHRQNVSSSSTLKLWRTSAVDLRIISITHSPQPAMCEATLPPQPLTTPDPLIDDPATNGKLSVSFIIGADGLVHSAFVLNSIGDTQDRAALNAIRSWRYRPALCNGVPTETEARIEFSSYRRIFDLE